MEKRDQDRPYQGGAQPVREHPPERPTAAGTIGRAVVYTLVLVVLVAAILWMSVLFAG